MTLEDAIAVLTNELGPLDKDEVKILTDTLESLHTEGYNDGWGEGYAEGVESTCSEGEE